MFLLQAYAFLALDICMLFVFEYASSYPMIRHNKRWVGARCRPWRSQMDSLRAMCACWLGQALTAYEPKKKKNMVGFSAIDFLYAWIHLFVLFVVAVLSTKGALGAHTQRMKKARRTCTRAHTGLHEQVPLRSYRSPTFDCILRVRNSSFPERWQ